MVDNQEIKQYSRSLEELERILQKITREDAKYLAQFIRLHIAKATLYGSRIATIASVPYETRQELADRYERSNTEFDEFRAGLDDLLQKYIQK